MMPLATAEWELPLQRRSHRAGPRCLCWQCGPQSMWVRCRAAVESWMRKERTWLISPAPSTVPKVSLVMLFVIWVQPGVLLLVSMATQRKLRMILLLGCWYQHHPRTGHGQSSPMVYVFWVSCCSAHYWHLSPQPLPLPAYLSLNSSTAPLSWHSLPAPLNYANLCMCLTF